MKKIMYAVMLLLGLSMVNVSCSTTPEAQAKKDAKAIEKALDKGDKKAEEKAWENFVTHKQYYENQGKGRAFQDAFDEAAAKKINK